VIEEKKSSGIYFGRSGQVTNDSLQKDETVVKEVRVCARGIAGRAIHDIPDSAQNSSREEPTHQESSLCNLDRL
jgi:hypothetical protein